MSVNKCLFIGNLGKDPETAYMPSGDAVTKFSIATSKKWKNKDGEQQELTTWVSIVTFKNLAEICGKYLKKGSKVYVECEYRLNKWQDKDGNHRYSPEFILQEMRMLDSKNSTEEQSTPSGMNEPMDESDDIPF